MESDQERIEELEEELRLAEDERDELAYEVAVLEEHIKQLEAI